jgi:hypothetical protein
MHLQKSTDADEMIVLHYHADNGIFADNKFRKAVPDSGHVPDSGQTLSFCGVNAHFQNGIAERRIRELQDHARTMLTHGYKQWLEAVDIYLWPYTLRTANDLHNHLPSVTGSLPPMECSPDLR